MQKPLDAATTLKTAPSFDGRDGRTAPDEDRNLLDDLVSGQIEREASPQVRTDPIGEARPHQATLPIGAGLGPSRTPSKHVAPPPDGGLAKLLDESMTEEKPRRVRALEATVVGEGRKARDQAAARKRYAVNALAALGLLGAGGIVGGIVVASRTSTTAPTASVSTSSAPTPVRTIALTTTAVVAAAMVSAAPSAPASVPAVSAPASVEPPATAVTAASIATVQTGKVPTKVPKPPGTKVRNPLLPKYGEILDD
jgi:hypothetical protein